MNFKKIFSPKFLIIAGVTFFASTAGGYAFTTPLTSLLSPVASNYNTIESQGKGGSFAQFSNEPKTEICPINGKLYSKSERALWETKRPILAMIENTPDARPQSGLSLADVIYEAVAEGGVTRFMGVFYCGAQLDNARVAPVRSARIYFVNIAAEYNTPVYMHVGGGNCSRDEASGQCTSDKRAFAIEELAKLGWRKVRGNDFDTTGDTGYPVLSRDENRLGADRKVATEHTMVGYLPAAWKQAATRGYTSAMPDGTTWLSGFKPWKIDAKYNPKGVPAKKINFDFWSNYKDYSVQWDYDEAQKQFKRSVAGAPQTDLDNQQQLVATNLIVQQVVETSTNDSHKHMLYEVIGSGTGYLFQQGTVTKIKWSKPKQLSRTIFTDLSGKEITLLPGVTFVELLPTTSTVDYL